MSWNLLNKIKYLENLTLICLKHTHTAPSTNFDAVPTQSAVTSVGIVLLTRSPSAAPTPRPTMEPTGETLRSAALVVSEVLAWAACSVLLLALFLSYLMNADQVGACACTCTCMHVRGRASTRGRVYACACAFCAFACVCHINYSLRTSLAKRWLPNARVVDARRCTAPSPVSCRVSQ